MREIRQRQLLQQRKPLRRRKPFRSPRIKGYQSCSCFQSHMHDSRGEAQYCNQLHLLKKAGEIANIETQKTFELKVNNRKICSHRVDFLVITNDGKWEVHEYKGFGTQVWQLKKKLFEACYPLIPYIVKTKKDLI